MGRELKTIRELSNKELSRWIAEKLGWTVVDVPFIAIDVKLGPDVYFTEEAGRQWRYQYPAGTIIRLVPDMVNDPAMTVMLLEKLIRAKLTPRFYDAKPPDVALSLYMMDDEAWIAELGRTVAESFAFTNGWQP